MLQLLVLPSLSTLDFYVERSDYPSAAEQQRVALFTAAYDRSIDGVALTLNRLVAHLVKSGHEVLVFAPDTGRRKHPSLTAAGAPVVRVPAAPCPIWSEYRLTFGLGREAKRMLAEFKPTVLHIAIQDPMGHGAQSWARKRGIPVVCSHHTRFERYLSYYGLGGALERLYWFGMRRFHGKCDATLPPSQSLALDLEHHGIPRVGVWPRGVDRSLFVPSARSAAWRELVLGDDGPGESESSHSSVVAEACRPGGSSSGRDPGGRSSRDAGDGGEGAARGSTAEAGCEADHPGDTTPIVLLVARLRWEKGLSIFAEVVAELAARKVRVRVAVVGDGPARLEFARRLPPSARFFGTLTGAKLAEAYASSDIFLYPSSTEGWGATCLEAQASGLPVVATRSSGIVEVVEHGVGGLLSPPHNATALADAVESLVDDPARRREMGRMAEAHAARFSWERSGARMLCEYSRHAPGTPPHMPNISGRPAPQNASKDDADSICEEFRR